MLIYLSPNKFKLCSLELNITWFIHSECEWIGAFVHCLNALKLKYNAAQTVNSRYKLTWILINFTELPSFSMCPTDRINLSEAPHCLVQHAICPKLDPKLHMPAAACEGLRQTMSDTMGLAVPLAERLSCQRYKKPHARRRQKVWLWEEFILSDSFAWKPFTSPHFLLHHYSCKIKKKSCPLPEAPAEARSPDQCVQAGETAWQRLGDKCFFRGGFLLHKKCTIVQVNRHSHCAEECDDRLNPELNQQDHCSEWHGIRNNVSSKENIFRKHETCWTREQKYDRIYLWLNRCGSQ